MNLPFFPFLRSREVERIASLQDQVIELGTIVRFIEADKREADEDKRDPQPRAPDGRFVSKRDIVAEQLRGYVAATTAEQRHAETEAYIETTRAAIQAAKRGRG